MEAARRAKQAIGTDTSLRENTLMRAAAREALKSVRDDLQSVDGVLGLLHYRGLIDSADNRRDVKAALDIVMRYTRDQACVPAPPEQVGGPKPAHDVTLPKFENPYSLRSRGNTPPLWRRR